MCWALREMSGVMLRSWIRDQQRPFLIHKFHLMNTIRIQTNCSARNERLTLSVTLEGNRFFNVFLSCNRLHPSQKSYIFCAGDGSQMHCDSPHMHKPPWNEVFLYCSVKADAPAADTALPWWHEPTHNPSERHFKATAVTTCYGK